MLWDEHGDPDGRRGTGGQMEPFPTVLKSGFISAGRLLCLGFPGHTAGAELGSTARICPSLPPLRLY